MKEISAVEKLRKEDLKKNFYNLKDNEQMIIETPFADVKARLSQDKTLDIIMLQKLNYPMKLYYTSYEQQDELAGSKDIDIKKDDFIKKLKVNINSLKKVNVNLIYNSAKTPDLPGYKDLEKGRSVKHYSSIDVSEDKMKVTQGIGNNGNGNGRKTLKTEKYFLGGRHGKPYSGPNLGKE